MFCVIQEIQTKKPDKRGYPKQLESKYMQMSISGEDVSHYYYGYSEERFERPVKKAYRISIHHSYRENGKVKKRQFVLCTVNYYNFAMGWFTCYDYCDGKIEEVAEELGQSIDDVYAIVEEKVNPLIEKIQEEFSQTEEYKTHEEHERVTTIYAAKKAEFNKRYGFENANSYEYDKCYDVFGELKNPDYLEKIKREYKQRKEYEEKSRGYQENFYSNYSKYFGGCSSGYHSSVSDNHNDEDKETLKQFYRVLSKKFHPDANPGADTSKEMKLLNQLKQEWGV